MRFPDLSSRYLNIGKNLEIQELIHQATAPSFRSKQLNIMHISISFIAPALLRLAAAASCPASGSPTYPEATEKNTALIPFVNTLPLIDATPLLDFNVAAEVDSAIKTLSFPSTGMDTGSTGIMIGAGRFGINKDSKFNMTNPGTEYLSSSQRLWEGYWVEADITFPVTPDTRRALSKDVIARVPIMIVTKASICTTWKANGGKCTDAQKTNIEEYPKDITASGAYVGVGFGRSSDEQPQALPDKVALINIVSIGGQAVEDMHQGYILTEKGVEVGLTSANTEGFCTTKLGLMASKVAKDWAPPNAAISVNSTSYDHGTALLDTGIPQSYVRVSQEMYKNTRTIRSKYMPKHPRVLVKGTRVLVAIPDEKNPIAIYDVTSQGAGAPQAGTMQPAGFVRENYTIPSTPFINTGRMIYSKFDAMLDADCGWFGMAERSVSTKKMKKRAACPAPASGAK